MGTRYAGAGSPRFVDPVHARSPRSILARRAALTLATAALATLALAAPAPAFASASYEGFAFRM